MSREGILLFLFAVLCGGAFSESPSQKGGFIRARCQIRPETGDPSEALDGIVYFAQKLDKPKSVTRVSLAVSGFDTEVDGPREHGFHVHEIGALGNACKDAGGHYNPHKQLHGGPTSTKRHVGDMGNIREDRFGNVATSFNDQQVSLQGEYSIIGRAVVIHATFDDLGLGGDAGSEATGNAGARLGCCIVEEY